MDVNILRSVCKNLCEKKTDNREMVPPKTKICKEILSKVTEDVVISRVDYENLQNFVKLYTDIIQIDTVEKEFKKSNFDSMETFEKYNKLYNLGFFYVKICVDCPMIEYLSLIEKIPFEQFTLPGTNLVPFTILSELFSKDKESEELVMQLMVLGDYFKYWELVNPYKEMEKTNNNMKMILSGMGNLSILISPGYLQDCVAFIQTFNKINSQTNSSGNLVIN